MIVDLDAARLLVLRAAYLKDTTGAKVTIEVSIAKLGATEAALARDRSRGPAVRWARRDDGRDRRASLSRDPPAADLRGHERDPAHDHRPRARVSEASRDVDVPRGASTSPTTSCSTAIAEGKGDKVALRFGDRAWTYAEVAERRARSRGTSSPRLTPEARVYIVLPDVPPFAWGIFGTLAAAACVTMGNPIAPIDDLRYVLGYVKAAVLITTPQVAEALAPTLAELPHLALILLVPDVGDRRGSRPRSPRRRLPAGHAQGRDSRVESRARSQAAASRRGRPAPARRPGDLAVHVGLDRPLEGGDAQPSRLRVQHRGATRSAPSAIASPTSRVSVPRLFFGYATGTNLWFPFAVGATVGLFSERPTAGEHRRARSRATGRRSSPTCRRCSASCSISTTSVARSGEPGSICRACGFTCPPARRCPSRCCAGSSSGSASRSTTASAPRRCSTSTARTAPAT